MKCINPELVILPTLSTYGLETIYKITRSTVLCLQLEGKQLKKFSSCAFYQKCLTLSYNKKQIPKPQNVLLGNRFNSAHGHLLIACAWIYALLFACSPLAHWGEYGPEPYGTACCIDWHLSNEHTMARSYTLALFIFCYILPCCVIVASYTGILVTVQASRKTMEQHASRQTQMSGIQTIIVKVINSSLINTKLPPPVCPFVHLPFRTIRTI